MSSEIEVRFARVVARESFEIVAQSRAGGDVMQLSVAHLPECESRAMAKCEQIGIQPSIAKRGYDEVLRSLAFAVGSVSRP